MTAYTFNTALNGIEITFDSRPEQETRDALKAAGFRWHKVKKLWYAKVTEERKALAEKIAEAKAEQIAEPVAKVQPLHSFKVGDVLASSWGWEQTNIDLYQVVALNGKSMITVKPCRLEVDEMDAVSSMSEDISYKLPESIVAEGDAIRRKVHNYGSGDFIEINSCANAYKYNGEKLYRSWYA